ncbi:MAG: hypothetical protein AABZ33_02960 [Chloroflexota bacterium]
MTGDPTTDDSGSAAGRPRSLAEVLNRAASSVDAIGAVAGATTTWSRDGQAFAVHAGDVVEFRLDGPIAAAALRTPDTEPSARGPEWVAVQPGEVDRFAVDRIESWFIAAWRRAG